jgi:alpha-galactosidase
MTVNCRAVAKAAPAVRIAGLCYGVTYYEHWLARFIGVPWSEVRCRAIGINHFTWITEFQHQGEDAWPRVRQVMQAKIDAGEIRESYTWELFRMFDAFPCVGDGHICEFVPGWQGKGAYYGRTFGIDAGHSFEEYAAGFDRVYEEMADQAYGRAPVTKSEVDLTGETFKDEDLFIDVLNASLGEDEIKRTVNLPNVGQASNLPTGAVLEATTLISGAGFEPLCFGELPPGLTAILLRIIGAQELTVEAAMQADRKLALQALVAGETVKTEAEAEKMLDVILETHRDYLPQFFE